MWLVLLAACGRVGFDPSTGDGGGSSGDAASADATFVGASTTYVKAPNLDVSDFFGTSVAISADGNTLVVGAPGEDGADRTINGDLDNDAATDAGAAYVYVRSGATWVFETYLKAPNGDAMDDFGRHVAISGDGLQIAVASVLERSTGIPADNSAASAGAVYLYSRFGATWTFDAYIKAPNAEALDEFGTDIALSGDGYTLVVGALGEDSANSTPTDNSRPNAGAVYVYRRNPSWVLDGYVKASNPDNADLFGASVAISADATTIAVGAIQESSSTPGINGDATNNSLGNAGAVYVFTRGAAWTQQAYVKASNPYGSAFFGTSVALSATGDTLVVGAIGESSPATGIDGPQANGASFASGAAYVFERAGATWAQTTYVKASNTDMGDEFARSVGISDDGQILACGTDNEASGTGDPADNSFPGAGAVYVFGRANASWASRAYLKAPQPGSDDDLGRDVDISGDGRVVVTGSAGEDGSMPGGVDEASTDAGAVYVIE